jgi:hypothetical protein
LAVLLSGRIEECRDRDAREMIGVGQVDRLIEAL